MQNEQGSVTHWIHEIQHGNREAAQKLWQTYYSRMLDLARKQLHNAKHRVIDEDDIASSAFETFYRKAEEGKFPDLADRNGLWRLLVRITANKVVDHQRKQSRYRRGSGKVRGESVFRDEFGEQLGSLAQVVGDEPTPEFVVVMREQMERLFELLNDDELKRIAVAKMEGYSIKEISTLMNRSVRTIERRLHLIRVKLETEHNL